MRYIVTGGGTGGHIYPAIAIIDKIKKEDKNAEILYIGTHDRMEKDIVPKHGIKYKSIKMYGLKRSLSLKNIKCGYYFIKSLSTVKSILKKFKPNIVIGVGGYVTYPVIFMASKLGINTLIHEQNSIPGLSNRKLEKYVDKIMVSFDNSKHYFKDQNKVIYTGNPTMEKAINQKKISVSTYGLIENKPTVLIVMGSLGSKTVNERINLMIPMFRDKPYQVLYVSGKDYYKNIDKKKLPDNVKVEPYVDNLCGIMKNTTLIVSRAGASTMSEIQAVKIPTIFIPSPYVTDNHQYKNAMDLVDKDMALLLEEKELNGDKLVRMIDEILSNKKKYNELKTNLENNKLINSSDRIYKIIVNLIKVG